MAPLLGDPELYRFVPQDPRSPDDVAKRFRRTAAGPPAGDARWWNWTAFLRDGEHAIGTIEISIDVARAAAALAYTFGRAYWGAGYASEASAAALDYVATFPAIVRAYAEIDTRNARSIALVERLGFTRTVLHERADAFKGTTSDEFVYERALRDAGTA